MQYIYSFIRTDLSLAQQIVQTAHSALHAGAEFMKDKKFIPSLILLQANDLKHLESIKAYLDSLDIKSHIFYEPDYDTGYTSITTEPLTGHKREAFKAFKLWKPMDISANRIAA